MSAAPREHLALVGPTASGKSALALEVASALGDVDIVSVDSMQVYRGMDVGTAKPAPKERAAVPHHLVDVADPAEAWSVARFQAEARAAIRDVEQRGRRALLVGGTGLYVRAVIDDLRFPGEDATVRAALTGAVATPAGADAAYRRLRALDPVAASRIEPGNARRVVRALEVIEVTGRPFSSFGPGLQEVPQPVIPVSLVGVWLPRAVVRERIGARVDTMRRAGLVDEVRALLDRSGGWSPVARQALGYKEIAAVLERGEEPDDTTFAAIVSRTRAFARRQRVWFRRDRRITWMGTSRNPEALLPSLLAAWSTP